MIDCNLSFKEAFLFTQMRHNADLSSFYGGIMDNLEDVNSTRFSKIMDFERTSKNEYDCLTITYSRFYKIS
jgi:hypothetical protein